ncbi:DUF2478 domain-containing protein [Oharaeibacter diazotrophicus]|uniref:Uncharacterized protein DUF2478 n=1 Tax=Oharaeibacter diazotrophicus TaxID=1920512 RepID=A0A4R6R9S3_9HYPH|nr:DUF2478 domain-containing protein [Oharaeibacter diazotrophicus]TDP82684.1 uncharacterized protein DUF2478 [Oharaeibacter diazotrophicus]BBE72554.1 hypothetical protein OHA_1_02150 [Pleomorphomonas sp. SM30]GLS76584.1 hypothetical protein GCM10007904_19210 [Oharaeibacter diazotrophicus]
MTSSLPLAAIFFARGETVDDVLAAAAETLAAEGLVVAGTVQAVGAAEEGCCGPMLVRDLSDGTVTVISQDLGKLATGCRLDGGALAEVAVRLDAALDRGADVLVVNRFGKAEGEGGGLRSVIERAVADGLPVVLAVRADHAAVWDAFHAGTATTLPADAAAVVRWCREAMAAPRAA